MFGGCLDMGRKQTAVVAGSEKRVVLLAVNGGGGDQRLADNPLCALRIGNGRGLS